MLTSKQRTEIVRGVLLLGFLGYLWYSIDPGSFDQLRGAAVQLGTLGAAGGLLWFALR